MEISRFRMNQWFFMYCHVFPVSICVPVPYTCVLLLHVCMYVCAWVLPTADTEMNVTEHEMWSNQKRRHVVFVHRLGETGP